MFAAKKLRHYLQAHSIHLISQADPMKNLMSKFVLSWRTTKWALLLQEFDITYVPQKAVKGQALADFLANHLVLDAWAFSKDLHDEDMFFIELPRSWKLCFDGS